MWQVSPSQIQQKEEMSNDCKALSKFFNYLEKNSTASIGEIERQAQQLFTDAAVDNRGSMFLVIDFKASLPCYQEIVKNWNQPIELGAPPSPPPLSPDQANLKYNSIEDDPFHWHSATFAQFKRIIVVGNDEKRIKYFRIERAVTN
ncbi:MAG: hypothetical protein ACXVAX_02145 [Pseudobdellovibrio sp.]